MVVMTVGGPAARATTTKGVVGSAKGSGMSSTGAHMQICVTGATAPAIGRPAGRTTSLATSGSASETIGTPAAATGGTALQSPVGRLPRRSEEAAHAVRLPPTPTLPLPGRAGTELAAATAVLG